MNSSIKVGYYICKDCGYLYEVGGCTFPTIIYKCPNGHEIGGEDHICKKKDLRIFINIKEKEDLEFMWFSVKEWLESYIPLTLE